MKDLKTDIDKLGQLIDTSELESLLAAGNNTEICRRFLHLLQHFYEVQYAVIIPPLQRIINRFVKVLLGLFCHPSFAIPEVYIAPLFSLMPQLTNLIALSSTRSADRYIQELAGQPDSMVKLLLLYSPRSAIQLPVKDIFDTNPALASLWYTYLWASVDAYPTEQIHSNMKRFLHELDSRLELIDQNVIHQFFRCTYVDTEEDRLLKQHLHAQVRQNCAPLKVINTPRKDRVAVVTGKWYPSSAVYRSISPFVKALAGHYSLCLVHLGKERTDLDTELFDDVYTVSIKDDRVEIGEILTNDFQVAFFPEVGMSHETLYLANLRLAPIQLAAYGHPVSTHGAKIDYFIGGLEVELQEEAEEAYSERLVLLPGLGAQPVFPERLPEIDVVDDESGRIVVNCPWTHQKINPGILATLSAIIEQAKTSVIYQFFPGCGFTRTNSLLPLIHDLNTVLGEDHVRVYADMSVDKYLTCMALGDLSLDSWPFGGYNTIIDSLVLGKPIVAREGRRFYNRASSALLRRLGLESLVAQTREEFVATAVRLIDDRSFLGSVQEQVRQAEIQSIVSSEAEAGAFKTALDFLIAEHTELQRETTRPPIMIQPH